MRHMTLMIGAMALLAVTAIAGLDRLPAAQAGNASEAGGAGERTVTFAVEKMTCAACPITVRKAMRQVEGVKSVTVDFEAKTATVVFDSAVASPEQIGAASADAGYPATPASQRRE